MLTNTHKFMRLISESQMASRLVLVSPKMSPCGGMLFGAHKLRYGHKAPPSSERNCHRPAEEGSCEPRKIDLGVLTGGGSEGRRTPMK